MENWNEFYNKVQVGIAKKQLEKLFEQGGIVIIKDEETEEIRVEILPNGPLDHFIKQNSSIVDILKKLETGWGIEGNIEKLGNLEEMIKKYIEGIVSALEKDSELAIKGGPGVVGDDNGPGAAGNNSGPGEVGDGDDRDDQ